jgi:Tfp pilus assembly protein PilV
LFDSNVLLHGGHVADDRTEEDMGENGNHMNGTYIKSKKWYSGQSMVEAVVAVGIVILLVTGLVVATTSTLRTGQMSKVRTKALQYAKDGLEIVRIIKDESWNDLPLNGTYCLKNQTDLVLKDGECPMDTDLAFSRFVEFSNNNTCTAEGFCRIVTVTVSWMESEKRSVTLTSSITNWRVR